LPTYVSEDNLYRDKVDEIFEEYVPQMKSNISSILLLELIAEISNILYYEELPKEIDKVHERNFDAKRESIRYLYYELWKLNKNKGIKSLIVEYLLKKFDSLSDNDHGSLMKKLATKPQHFDKVK